VFVPPVASPPSGPAKVASAPPYKSKMYTIWGDETSNPYRDSLTMQASEYLVGDPEAQLRATRDVYKDFYELPTNDLRPNFYYMSSDLKGSEIRGFIQHFNSRNAVVPGPYIYREVKRRGNGLPALVDPNEGDESKDLHGRNWSFSPPRSWYPGASDPFVEPDPEVDTPS